MNGLLSWMPPEVAQDIGWTLIHFLWQGLLLTALLNVILPLCRSAAVRHNWALITLAMMALAPVVTFVSIRDFGGSGGAVVQAPAAVMPAAASISPPWISWLVVFWLIGIVLLSLRALGGWYVAGRLGRRDTLVLPAELLQRCHGLQHRLAVTRPVRFLLSRRITVPVVIGLLRPLVLIPLSALAGLSPLQLDALILHELAHIRRLDTVTNVLLVGVETILFYHPAVWWVSRRVRIEREHCCDDLAVSTCGDAALYVEALTALEMRKTAFASVLAANGGELKARAARLLGDSAQPRKFSLSAMAGLAFLSLVVATVATAQNATPAGRQSFAIRVVDEKVGKDAQKGPLDDDRVQVLQPAKGEPGALWLKREGQITGDVLADASVYVGQDGKPTIRFRFTPEAAKQFGALTQASVGHRLAVVVKDRTIAAPTVMTPILGGSGEIMGDFNTDQARTLVAQMLGTAAKP